MDKTRFHETLAETMRDVIEIEILAGHAEMVARSINVPGETFGELIERANRIYRGYRLLRKAEREHKDPHTAKLLIQRVFGQDRDW